MSTILIYLYPSHEYLRTGQKDIYVLPNIILLVDECNKMDINSNKLNHCRFLAEAIWLMKIFPSVPTAELEE